MIIAIIIIIAGAVGGVYYYVTLPLPEITLTIIHHHGGPEQIEQWQNFAAQYKKENPHVTIEYVNVAWAELATKVMTMHSAGEGADIIHFYKVPEYFDAGVFDVPPDWVIEDLNDHWDPISQMAAIDFETGQVYGYPTEFNMYGLLYNKRLLAEAGFDNPPNTLEEFWQIAEACTKYDPVTGEMTQAGVVMPSGWRSGVYFTFELWLSANNGAFWTDDYRHVAFNDEHGLAAMQTIYDIFHTYKVCDSSWTMTYSDHIWMEKTAMYLPAGNPLYATLTTKMGDNITNLGVVPFPMPEGGSHSGYGDPGWFMGVSNDCKNKEEAWKFLKWLAEPGHPGSDYPGTTYSRLGWYQVTYPGCFPTRDDDVQNLESLLMDNYWLAQYVDWRSMYDFLQPIDIKGRPGMEEIAKIHQDTIERMIFEGLSPQETLNIMETEDEKVLSAYYED